MKNFEVIILVFVILLTLLALGERMRLPNPVLLVVAGLAIGFAPSLPALSLNPEMVFALFLPPILYDAASNTSWHEFKKEIRPISTLAIALVFFTTTGVAIASFFLLPGFTWPLAFVLGAIVSPPDAVAATSITRGLGLNQRVITILEGESLVNDASALIAFRFAVAALGPGVFVFWKAGVDFLFVTVGGVIIGMLVGVILVQLHKRILGISVLSTSLSLLTPFISYLTAEGLHISGVLAVVSTGLLVSWSAPEIYSYQTRLRNKAVWDTLIFLLNGVIFILIGLQLRPILTDLSAYNFGQLLSYGLLISGVTILIRILWVFGATYVRMAGNKTRDALDSDSDTWKNVAIVAWTGTRGVVSLATALALPLTLADESLFPQRSLILFLAFVVIFVTLVVQGLSLPLLIRMLGVRPNTGHLAEERNLRLAIIQRVIEFIDAALPGLENEKLRLQVKTRYVETAHLLSKELGGLMMQSSKNGTKASMVNLFEAQTAVQRFQRELLITFHKEGNYNQSIIRRLEQELDQEEFHLGRQQRKNE